MEGSTVVICAGRTLLELKDLYLSYIKGIPKVLAGDKSKQFSPKIVACFVQGVCGMVCTDFLDDFEVLNTDGETYKEVILI